MQVDEKNYSTSDSEKKNMTFLNKKRLFTSDDMKSKSKSKDDKCDLRLKEMIKWEGFDMESKIKKENLLKPKYSPENQDRIPNEFLIKLLKEMIRNEKQLENLHREVMHNKSLIVNILIFLHLIKIFH
jgi:hypothetical protein